MAAGFLMMGLASVGFPMTLGFIAEDLLVQGAVMDQPIFAFILIAATALNGMNVMRCFFKLFSGRRVHTGEPDLTKRESRALSVVLLLLLLGGLAPSAITTREFDNAGDAHGQAVIEHRISSIKGASFSRTAASERSR
jgi:NADH:ubiquinone oxidoreductase subunit 4 (subunit M)